MQRNQLFENWLQRWDFPLPPELIASRPLSKRDSSRLLVVRTGQSLRLGAPPTGRIQLVEHLFSDLPGLLQPGDLLVRNNTKVLPQKLLLQRASGARIEALGLPWQPSQPEHHMLALLKGRRKLKAGEILQLESPTTVEFEFQPLDPGTATVMHNEANGLLVAYQIGQRTAAWRNAAERLAWFERHGQLPLPPYMHRDADQQDQARYQTIFASRPGSIAAPTAGLHFSQSILRQLHLRGILAADLELRIGYGTFAPLQPDHWQHNRLHAEDCHIPTRTAWLLNRQQATNGRTIAIGTTSLRCLESAWLAETGHLFRQGPFQTSLFLRPPARIQSIDGLITNFHLPRSSLLMLIGAILGRENTLTAYQYAIQHRFRFFSYGDAMLILP
ncbi:MAG: tRNA preQ1(34) S-adenosylmethionine ribosyltransferase-isomerase QueA [Leptospiraceae bacterium]|nr:tRNA preQ1(34) S-adenosylmethionine ribosyltransferase-isomerase QueA [Leptospiraceae bacterium]